MSPLPVGSLLLGIVLSILISSLAYFARSLSASGVLGAVLVGTLTFGFGGWSWGLLLIAFFVTSSLLSHYRRRDKEPFAEKFAKGGQRDLAQALANGGLGAVLAFLNFLFPSGLWTVAFWGSMAAASADTWATELGVLSSCRPRLITTSQEVSVGTSGAISFLGLVASLAGSLTMAFLGSLIFWLFDPRVTLGAVFAGLGGSLVDSILGATLQSVYWCPRHEVETERTPLHTCGTPTIHRRGWKWLNNDGVNFLASLAGGVIAALFWFLPS